jgi:hypothetical protein
MTTNVLQMKLGIRVDLGPLPLGVELHHPLVGQVQGTIVRKVVQVAAEGETVCLRTLMKNEQTAILGKKLETTLRP